MTSFESGNIRSCFRAVVQIKLAEFVIPEHAQVQREVIVSGEREERDCECKCEEGYTFTLHSKFSWDSRLQFYSVFLILRHSHQLCTMHKWPLVALLLP